MVRFSQYCRVASADVKLTRPVFESDRYHMDWRFLKANCSPPLRWLCERFKLFSPRQDDKLLATRSWKLLEARFRVVS